MAGSRLETIGSVFTRTRNLMRAGVLKEKPLWFDVYEAFPPLREPVFRRPRLRYGKAKADIQDIFYREDQIRAKFFSAYGSGQKAFDLFNPNFKSTCQRFVEKYMELQDLGETDEEELFVKTGKALLAEGVILRRVKEARTVNVRPQVPLEGNQPQEDAQKQPAQEQQEPGMAVPSSRDPSVH
ncbi:28S ribosomal protein S23, mitochondrial isoform X1 [Cricetulus griseus]|uniref:Small ribosomal subunit protein mS23 n=1 Tax=Cricetulus griseus TaxID=10029 RepID=A0A9J7JYF3_CRIGR|nr:28S ribosomal protein S23, mitochondrial isoform X1 [Cricetulus griseus]ERE67283.1 28S ribosomal protein S23 [Cricetulus griseus]